jgi:NAD(P)-dependent dehydrogenase (short-subunit alcohol dehydrogenase family)
MGRLTGKSVFVTGAGGGIGQALCRRFLAEGASVAAADLDVDAVRRAIATAAGGQAVALSCDVTNDDDVRDSVSQAVSALGQLNVLVAIAGGSSAADGRVTEVSDEEFWRVISVDLYGTLTACRHVVPHLVDAGGGSVILFSSITAFRGVEDKVAYSAAKGGVSAMTRAMAAGHAREHVRVNALAPGVTLTPRVREHLDANAHTRRHAGRQPLGVIEPERVADVAVMLASDEAAAITGQVLLVDGGFTVV